MGQYTMGNLEGIKFPGEAAKYFRTDKFLKNTGMRSRLRGLTE